MADELPLRFVHDDDVVLWAVIEESEPEGWVVLRVDADRPQVERLDKYVCEGGHWELAGQPGWAISAGSGQSATWQIYRPGVVQPWTLYVKGSQHQLTAPGEDVGHDELPAEDAWRGALPYAPAAGVTEAASWRLAAELARRHPGELWIAHTVPIEGVVYDCLTLWRPGDGHDIGPPIFQFNRGGSIQIHHTFDGREFADPPRWTWWEYLATEEAYGFLRQLEQTADLPSITGVPSTTPTTLVYRLLAAMIAGAAPLTVDRVRIISGFDDSPYAAPNDHLFADFPAAADRVRETLHDDPLGTPHRRFWFITVNDDPRLAFETTGNAWARDGGHFDLMRLYGNAGRSLGAVVGHLLPHLDRDSLS